MSAVPLDFPRPVKGHPRWMQITDWAYVHESKLFRISRSLSFEPREDVSKKAAKDGYWIYDAWYGETTSESMATAITRQSVTSFDAAVTAVTAFAKQLKSSQQTVAASTSSTEGVSQP
jgi:hypothetical protein